MSKSICFFILFFNLILISFCQEVADVCGIPIEQNWKYIELNGIKANMRIIYKDILFGIVRGFYIEIDLENDSFYTTSNNLEKCIFTNEPNCFCHKYENKLKLATFDLILPEISLSNFVKIFKYLPDGTMKFNVWLTSSVKRKFPNDDDFNGGAEFKINISQSGVQGTCIIGKTTSTKLEFIESFALDPTSPIKNLKFKFKAKIVSNSGIFNRCLFSME